MLTHSREETVQTPRSDGRKVVSGQRAVQNKKLQDSTDKS